MRVIWLMRRALFLLALMPALAQARPVPPDEDGYALWLRYRPVAARLAGDRVALAGAAGPVAQSACAELARGLSGVLARRVRCGGGLPGALAVLRIDPAGAGEEGYRIVAPARRPLMIAARGEPGLLYGAFALLRRIAAGGPRASWAEVSAPRAGLRMLDHWDNPDRTVERGYAGQSLWDWWRLPDQIDPRLTDYARANASVGINAVVLNNVNARDSAVLTDAVLAKAAAIAGVLRPWHIRVFLSVRFSAPMELGGMASADPADPAVAQWWRDAADRVYRAIPDFGGFLVKADSEGQPGPRAYGRSHADGANMLAAALAPHGGTVLWRAFVYSERDATDRVRQAYDQLQPLDGRFAANVLLQVKNGPLDFQPREPFHPLFGAMPHTRLALEVQITREYLGFANGIVYLAPLWHEVLQADTGRARVAEVIAPPGGGGAIAGVANIGTDRNWSGSHFDQANWYAFGRLAWDPALDPAQIAREWLVQTFSADPVVVRAGLGLMLHSREDTVNVMTPLGLAHQMATGHHYGPAPWIDSLPRPEWNPHYYNRADAGGIGFDRTATGSNALAQYAPAVAARLGHDLDLLLWFHHCGWDDPLPTGRTVWQELVYRYDRGEAGIAAMRAQWQSVRGAVDARRFAEIDRTLVVQQRDARWWRDASLAYFLRVSGRPLPAGSRPPAHPLEWYQAIRLYGVPGAP